PLSACGGVFCSSLLQSSQARSSPAGAVSTLIGLFRFPGPALLSIDKAIKIKAHFAVYPARHEKRAPVEAFLSWLHGEAAKVKGIHLLM
ncbi:hypothetical protein RCH10_005113, partial [Variovorax sp. GrIS 2.14]